MNRIARTTFRSLGVHNYRLYFVGQVVSSSGTWMQAVAQSWLVLQLTHSGVALGITVALQFLPVLFGAPFAGLLADRTNCRRLLIATQSAAGLLAGVLAVLAVTGAVSLWMVYVLAFSLGCVSAIDNPVRRAFLSELVTADLLPNAVSLNSAVFVAGRVFGPALAGILISTVGLGWCFAANAASYVVAVAAFLAMDRRALFAKLRAGSHKGQLREGFTYVWHTPELRLALAMSVIVGTFTYEYQVSLPLLAERTFGGDAGTFGAMFTVMSVGSLVGALVIAHRNRAELHLLTGASTALGISMLMTALAPALLGAYAMLLFVGAAGAAFTSIAQSVLQLGSAPEMRGRVMALFTVAFVGSTPIGGPIVGAFAQEFGARAALVIGGLAALAAATLALGTRARPEATHELEPV